MGKVCPAANTGLLTCCVYDHQACRGLGGHRQDLRHLWRGVHHRGVLMAGHEDEERLVLVILLLFVVVVIVSVICLFPSVVGIALVLGRLADVDPRGVLACVSFAFALSLPFRVDGGLPF